MIYRRLSLIDRRKHTEFLFEIATEYFGRVVAELECYVRDVHPAFAQHLRSPFHPYESDKLDWGFPGGGCEFLVEMDTAHAEVCAQFLDGEVGTTYVGDDISHRLLKQDIVKRRDVGIDRFGTEERITPLVWEIGEAFEFRYGLLRIGGEHDAVVGAGREGSDCRIVPLASGHDDHRDRRKYRVRFDVTA